jgi:carboxymethylenebutenolidase
MVWFPTAAAASFHGGGLAVADEPKSPHLAADRIAAAVYVAGAQDEVSFTAEQGGFLEWALTDAGADHTVEFYPARHGFAVPDNPTWDPAAEARHWDALRDLYRAHLSSRGSVLRHIAQQTLPVAVSATPC